jgi:hypothetical protein
MGRIEGRLEWLDAAAAAEAKRSVIAIAVLAAAQWKAQNKVSSEIHRQYTSWM